MVCVKYLNSLCLASTSRSLRCSIEVEMEGTDQCTIATISEWSDHQSRRGGGREAGEGEGGSDIGNVHVSRNELPS